MNFVLLEIVWFSVLQRSEYMYLNVSVEQGYTVAIIKPNVVADGKVDDVLAEVNPDMFFLL